MTPPHYLPTADQLGDAPELAAVAVLDAALRVTRMALLVNNPDLGDPDVALDPQPPALISALALLLVDRVDELHRMITWYRIALDPPRPNRLHDELF